MTLTGLFQNKKTMMYARVPRAVSVILECVRKYVPVDCSVCHCQSARKWSLPNTPLRTRTANCFDLGGQSKRQAFLIGRQICVIICMFIVARITSANLCFTIYLLCHRLSFFLPSSTCRAEIETRIGMCQLPVDGQRTELAYI